MFTTDAHNNYIVGSELRQFLLLSGEHRRHSLEWHGGCLRKTMTRQRCRSSTMSSNRAVGCFVQSVILSNHEVGLHCFTSALFTLYCALQNDLDQGVLKRICDYQASFRGKEWFLPSSVVGDMSDELIRPVLCVRDAQESSIALVLECLDSSLQVGSGGLTFASVQQDGDH